MRTASGEGLQRLGNGPRTGVNPIGARFEINTAAGRGPMAEGPELDNPRLSRCFSEGGTLFTLGEAMGIVVDDMDVGDGLALAFNKMSEETVTSI